MIKLSRKDKIEKYQVELVLKEKVKQSPFIAILILTREQGEISAGILHDELLPPLPFRACENLLLRLELQGYLVKEDSRSWRLRESYYVLTDFGEGCAQDGSFWMGEKGIYNIYVTKSKLIEQEIVKIEKVERKPENVDNAKSVKAPWFDPGTILKFRDKEVCIDNIDKKCLELKPIDCVLEIQASGDDCIVKLRDGNQTIYESSIDDVNEGLFKDELLINCDEFEYCKNKKVIFTDFSAENLSFVRKIKINNPYFRDNLFDPVEIDNVSHMPEDKKHAEEWLNELLFKSITGYFFDEESFDDYVYKSAERILSHYENISLPRRKDFIENLSNRDDAFYQLAKIETMDYLTY